MKAGTMYIKTNSHLTKFPLSRDKKALKRAAKALKSLRFYPSATPTTSASDKSSAYSRYPYFDMSPRAYRGISLFRHKTQLLCLTLSFG